MKYLYGGLGGLFLLFAVANALRGHLDDALVGGGLGLLLLILAFALVPNETRAIRDFQTWLIGHEPALRRGARLYYEDLPITLGTELTQFAACFSFGAFSQSYTSRYLLRRSRPATVVRLRYTLLTLLLGWWELPFGPVYTVRAIAQNLRGGRVQTVEAVLNARRAELAEEAAEAALDLAREQAHERAGRRLL